VTEASRVEPDFYAPHLYLGTIELRQDRNATAAVAQYRLFLAEHPPARSLTSAAPDIRQAFTQAGQPVPPGVPAASASHRS